MNKILYATVRESEGDMIPIECRFENGEKYAAIMVADDHPDLACLIAWYLTEKGRED